MFDTAYILSLLLSIPGIVLAFSAKGYSQALVAKMLGDDTPERDGKLTLNPMAHIDLIGFLCILLLRIGWGKPVRTNSRNYKNIKRDTAIQILSGPVGLVVTGFILSFISALLFAVGNKFFSSNSLFSILYMIFTSGTMTCLSLAVFYMLPLPGLDGYNFIVNFLPYSAYRKLYVIEKYSSYIFLGFIFLTEFTGLINFLFWPAEQLYSIFNKLWFVIFTPLFGLI